MTNLMHKLFKNKSTQRVIVSLKTPQHQQRLLEISPSLIPQQTHNFPLTKPQKSLENVKSTEPLKLYPSFPFGYLLNPISSIGVDPLAIMEVDEGETETDNEEKVWADSVKKKRKKKMNKHKYKKLRKRLRRKT